MRNLGRNKKICIGLLAVMLSFSATTLVAVAYETGEEESSDTVEELTTGGGYAVTGQLSHVGYSAILYTADNGLPTSDANCVYTTSDGYVWVGGYSGVLRYDGMVFERMDGSGGLTSGKVMFEDSGRRFWVGTNDNGAVVVNTDGTQTHFTYKEGLPSSTIRGFAEDESGNIFIGTTGGICYADSNNNLFLLDDERINNQYVIQMFADSEGTIYVNTRDGDIFSIKNKKVSAFYSSEELGMGKITAIYTDEGNPGRLYFGTNTSMLYYGTFGNTAEKMKAISVEPASDIAWITKACNRIWINSDSVIGYLDEYQNFVVVDDVPMDSSIEMMTADYREISGMPLPGRE